jgi:hypothetical protein
MACGRCSTTAQRPPAEEWQHQLAELYAEDAGPAVRVIRDALFPFMLKMTANSKQVTEQFRYHIDWNTPIGSADGRLLPASKERT